jgi:acyl-CoA reductase-like NAD-dependent aldehyde dehydrogenase
MEKRGEATARLVTQQIPAMFKLAAALAAGCTVVLKPPLETPLDANVIAEAGLPPGRLNIVVGGRDAGQNCTTQSRILIPRSRCGEVVDAIAGIVDDLVVGDPLDYATRIGPMASSSWTWTTATGWRRKRCSAP